MLKYCCHCMAQIEGTETECPVCGKQVSIQVPAHHLLPGTILAKKFYVGKALGEGGFGITYIGRDINLDMKIAVKEYYPNGYVNRNNTVSLQVNNSVTEGRKDFFEKGRERFLQEARILARFSGEAGVVDVRDFFEENNTAYIIMEYLEGQDLKSYLSQRGTLTPEQTVRLLMPVMNSLRKIHEQGLIHRDISPDNIMLVGDKVKLLDFGAARSVSAAANKSLSVMLKPGYAPEEQYRSKGIQGPWTDVYALCATMYKCITGITPDDATQRVFSDEVKTPSALGISISQEIENAVMRGMSVQQKDRYQSIEDLIRGLQGIEVEMTGTEQTVSAGRKVQEDDVETRYVAGSGGEAASGRPEHVGEKAECMAEKASLGGSDSDKAGNNSEEHDTDHAGLREMPAEEGGQSGETPSEPLREERSEKEAESAKKKSKKLLAGVIAGAGAALAVLVTAVVMLFSGDSGTPDDNIPVISGTDPAENGYLMKNSDSVELTEPETALDAKKIYSELAYSERMFYGEYTLAPSPEDDLELSRYQNAMDYGILTNETGKYLTNIPCGIEAGPKTLNHAICSIREHSWMRLYYYTEDGYANNILAAYEVEGKLLRIRPVAAYDVNNIENPYTLSDTVIEYGFEFSGPNLTLTLDGKSVHLRAEGFDKEIVGSSYHNDYLLYTDASPSAGSPLISGISRFRFKFSGSSGYFNLYDDNGDDIRDGIGRLTEEGLFTFSCTDGHVQNTKFYNHQYVYFYCHNDGLVLTDGETVYYYQGEERPEEEALTDDGTENGDSGKEESSREENEEAVMSDELFDFTFELDGDVYQLPCSYSCFTENGWTISSTGYSGDSTIPGNRYDSYYMAKDGHRITVYSYNLSGNTKSISECKVGGIQCWAYDGAVVTVAKGIGLSSAAEEIKEAFGMPNSNNTGDDYESLTYQVNESTYNYVRFMCYSNARNSYIEIKNFVADEGDNTVTNEERPEYLDSYTAPEFSGNDLVSAVLNVEGDLYQLPAPVSTFVDNGWEITQQPGSVVSGGSDSVRVERDGKKLYLNIVNLAEYQTTVLNCAVYRISVSSDDEIEIAVPAGEEEIAIGMTKEELEAVLTDEFECYEGTNRYSYSYSEYRERDFSITIYVDKDTEAVSGISISCGTWGY